MTLGARLSTMMFLQFFIWGAWYTTIAVYMTAHGMQTLTHWPFTVNPIAAIAAPFFLGLVADRYFATEKVLGALHILGGLVMFAVPQATGAPATFIVLLLLYNLCFMPTLGLSNSLSFHHIADQEKLLPVRLGPVRQDPLVVRSAIMHGRARGRAQVSAIAAMQSRRMRRAIAARRSRWPTIT